MVNIYLVILVWIPFVLHFLLIMVVLANELGTGTRFYDKAFGEFFSTSNMRRKDQDSAASGSVGNVQDFYRFGWLLFLALRTHVFTHCKNLVICTNGLVSILVCLFPFFLILFIFYIQYFLSRGYHAILVSMGKYIHHGKC